MILYARSQHYSFSSNGDFLIINSNLTFQYLIFLVKILVPALVQINSGTKKTKSIKLFFITCKYIGLIQI